MARHSIPATQLPRSECGFTVVQGLLAVGIVAVVVAIQIAAINPAKQLGDSRNSRRRADVAAILNAVYHYAVIGKHGLPITITPTATEICKTGAVSCLGLVNLDVLTTQSDIVYIPMDPLCPKVCNPNGVGYTVAKDANGRVTVAAIKHENNVSIAMTR